VSEAGGASTAARRDPNHPPIYRSAECGFSDSAGKPLEVRAKDLEQQAGGPVLNPIEMANACKFSEAYVIAHEVGHHVQDELGILPRVTEAQQASSSQAEANALQVRVGLQADCFAGIWAHHAQQKHNFLDQGDVDQALQTASAIGDDRLQRETQGYVVPDAFTHGTSAQSKRWFLNGFNSGNISDCNTLSTGSL
jgi:predicted metalloprotease